MNSPHSLKAVLLLAIFSSGVLVCPSAFAMAPLYFDLEGLFLYAVLWLVGWILFLTLAAASKEDKKSRSIFLVVGALIFFAPAILIAVAVGNMKLGEYQSKENFKLAEQFCSSNQEKVLHPVEGSDSVTIAIRFADGFTPYMPFVQVPPMHGTKGLAAILGTARNFDASRVQYLEGEVETKPVGSAQHSKVLYRFNLSEVRAEMWRSMTFNSVRNFNEQEIPSLTASYEIIIGENWVEKVLPDRNSSESIRMKRASLRIVRRSDGTTIARDKMLFSNSMFVPAKNPICVRIDEELPKLLEEVFKK